MKEAKQARSRETQRKLIRAAEEVMREHGAEGLKVDVLTSKAECSTGSFYNLFKDRNAIILAVMVDFKERILSEIQDLLSAERLDKATREDVFRLIVGFSVEVYSRNDSLFRVSQSFHSEIPELIDNGNEIVGEAVKTLGRIPCLEDLAPAEIEFIVRTNIASCDHYTFWNRDGACSGDLQGLLLKLLINAYC